MKYKLVVPKNVKHIALPYVRQVPKAKQVPTATLVPTETPIPPTPKIHIATLAQALKVPFAPIECLTPEERVQQQVNVTISNVDEIRTMLLAYEVANWVLE